MVRYAPFVLLAGLITGCMSVLYPVEMPMVVPAMRGEPLTPRQQMAIEGLYVLRQGHEVFGDTAVMRFVHGHLCIYATQIVLFSENAVCVESDTVSVAGYYRASRSTRVGDLELQVLPQDGGRELIDSLDPPKLILSGYAQDDGSMDHIPIRLERIRGLGGTKTFHIIGHRSGGRNSERLGRSENSIEMAMFAETMGCTGIETDIHVTKDGQLIIFHDDEFSPRTIRSTYILGAVKDFTLQQIRDNATLIYGERIPTLEEYLTAVIDSTTLNLVWLDVKVPDQAERILEIQQRAMERSLEKGRDLKIYFGVPSDDVLSGYRSSRLADSTPVLCELSTNNVRSLKSCKLWAPRWTNGLQNSAVQSMHPDYEVVTWTLDSPDYMTDFIRNGHFDGILTNYPSMLAGLYYQYGTR